MLILTITNSSSTRSIGSGTDTALPSCVDWATIGPSASKTFSVRLQDLNSRISTTGFTCVDILQQMVNSGKITYTVFNLAATLRGDLAGDAISNENGSAAALAGIDWIGFDSIMMGTGDYATSDRALVVETVYPRVKLASLTGPAPVNPMNFTDRAYRDLQPREAGGTFNMGPELSFGRYMDLYGGDNGAGVIVKTSVSGSQMGGTDGWHPGAVSPTLEYSSNDGVASGPTRSITNLWTRGTAYLDAVIALTGLTVRSCTIQNVNDAQSAPLAADYQSKTQIFMNAVWTKYGSQVVFIIPLININSGGILTSRDALRTAQLALIAANPGKAFPVYIDDLPFKTADFIHYDADGNITYGNRWGRVLADALRPARNDDQGTGPAPIVQAANEPSVYGNGTIKPRAPEAKVGDVQILAVTTSYGLAVTVPTLSDAQGYVPVTGGAKESTQAGVLRSWTALFWRRIDQTMLDAGVNGRALDATVADNNNINLAAIINIRKANASGEPFETPTLGAVNANNPAVSVAGVTTTGPNRLVLTFVGGYYSVGTGGTGSWTNATEVYDTQRTFPGTEKQHLAIAKSVLPALGTAPTVTAAVDASASVWSAIQIAVRP